MIQTKKLIPEIYSDSYDMSIFTGLLDLIYNAREVDIQAIKGSHSPNYCFTNKLKSLSKSFNLETDRRDLISEYRHLIKIKGTIKAIESALYLCGAEKLVNKTIEDNGVLTLTVELGDMDTKLFYELMTRLLPATMIVKIKPF